MARQSRNEPLHRFLVVIAIAMMFTTFAWVFLGTAQAADYETRQITG